MTLFVYDFEFNLLLAENGIIMSRWAVYYNDVGTFEIHLPITSELTRIVNEETYLLVKQNGLRGIVTGLELGDELILYGRTCNWLLSKRITPQNTLSTVACGEKAAELVNAAFSDVENFSEGNTINGESAEFESREDATLNVVRDLLDLSDLGHELTFDEKEKIWQFNILSGSQSELVLSEVHKNAYDTKICSDILDLATFGKYKRKTSSGYSDESIYTDSEKTGIYRWEAILSGDTEKEAESELIKLSKKSKVYMTTSDVKWNTDYFLGDTVKLQITKGDFKTIEEKRVKGVEVTMRCGQNTEQPIFE